MKEYFIKHKWHLVIFVVLILITGVSGYHSFQISNFKFQISNQIQNPNKQNEQKDSTSSLSHNITTSPTDNGYQTTDNNLTTTTEQQNNTTIEKQNDSLIIQSSDYNEIITATSTVYDMMDKLQSQGKFSFKTKEFAGLGYFVEEINGVKQDPKAGKYWIYYINGESAKVGISNYILKPNDIIEWKYENTNL